MKLTLKNIKEHLPCEAGWKTICKNLKTTDLEKEFTLIQALELNGLGDAVWALRTKYYKTYCLFLCDVARLTSHLYAKDNTDISNVAIEIIESIPKYRAKKIPYKKLRKIAKKVDFEVPKNLRDFQSSKFSKKHCALVSAYSAAKNSQQTSFITVVAAQYAGANSDEIEKIFRKHFE